MYSWQVGAMSMLVSIRHFRSDESTCPPGRLCSLPLQCSHWRSTCAQIAYAEQNVKPVVSDFDTFTIGRWVITHFVHPCRCIFFSLLSFVVHDFWSLWQVCQVIVEQLQYYIPHASHVHLPCVWIQKHACTLSTLVCACVCVHSCTCQHVWAWVCRWSLVVAEGWCTRRLHLISYALFTGRSTTQTSS